MTIDRLPAAYLAVLLTVLPATVLAAPVTVGIAAVVNEEIITTSAVEERSALILATNNLAPTPENQQRIQVRVIPSLIDEALQMQEAKRLSIEVPKTEIEGAIRQMEESRRVPLGTLRESLEKQGLSVRSLENQLRAQIAWSKVVQRKLRREVSISADEVARAQAAAAADPGTPEVRLSAISIMIPRAEDEAAQAALAQQIAQSLREGATMADLYPSLAKRRDVRISPPAWVAEEKLQPAMQQAMRALKPGEVSAPLKSLNTYQIVQLIDRRMARAVPDGTEVLIKEIRLPLPAKPDATSAEALRQQADNIRNHPGSCENEGPVGSPAVALPVAFQRTLFGQLPPALKPVIASLDVAEASSPLLGKEAVQIFMLCERIDAGQGNLPPAAEIRRQLFNEKIELEAQKHLRNLKRDAFIDVKLDPRKAPANG